MRPRKASLTAHSEGPPKEKISLSLDYDRALPLVAARKVDELKKMLKSNLKLMLKKMKAVRCERCRGSSTCAARLTPGMLRHRDAH